MARILIIEDDEMNRDMLVRRLTRRGYEVEIAVDGEAGVNAAHTSLPDLILMDIGLPVIDGIEATRMLKSSQGTAAVPIIALTAHAFEEDRDKSIQAGCDDFDTKPIEIDRLVQKIEALLDK